MPFTPGERVDLVFTGDPDTTTLTFQGHARTLANGGLTLKRKSALKAIVRVPLDKGKYPYEWRDEHGRSETGHLRVQGSQRSATAPSEPPAPRYRGPGSGAR